jgi:uncharacterized membrane protein YbaN (DUF454 family)
MKQMTQIKKWLLIVIGSISVGLGMLGVFLPLLPTTPFLLLAAACYIRSSEKFYNWLIYHKWFGSYIRNYHEGRGIPLKAKIMAISLIWLTIGFSAVFIVPVLIAKIVLFGIAIGVTMYLLKIKTLQPDSMTEQTEET